MTIYDTGTTLFCCQGSEADIDSATIEAKAYVTKYNLTVDDIKIVRRNNAVCVITKRPVALMEKKQCL